MVPRLLGGFVVVIAIVVLVIVALIIDMDRHLEQGAEGPYRKRENARCICK